VNALTGKAAEEWKLNGTLPDELKPPVAPEPIPDVTPESSPDTPSEVEPEEEPTENEAASEPAVTEQPKPGLSNEEKSARKKYNDYKRYLEEKVKRESLEAQIAELKAASAPAKPAAEAPKPVNERPKRPKMRDFETAEAYDDAMDTYEDAFARYYEHVADSKVQNLSATTAAERDSAKFEARVEARSLGKSEYFTKDFPSSPAMDYVIRYDADGLDYVPTLTKAEAKRIADLTAIPDFDKLMESNPPHAAYLLGVARTTAKIEMQKLVKPAAPQPKPTGLRPSSEINLDRRSAPVGDVRGKAIANGDLATFRAIENENLRR